MGKAAVIAFNVELEGVGLVESFDVITLDEAAAVDELACSELVEVKDPLEVDKDELDVTSLTVAEVSARI